jgi:hypothetical protein
MCLGYSELRFATGFWGRSRSGNCERRVRVGVGVGVGTLREKDGWGGAGGENYELRVTRETS